GIYMFNWKELRKYLRKDNKDKDSVHDFGKNVLPKMLEEEKKMYAWNFKGYWKDVGTVRSYWESNMDLLDDKNTLNLYDKSWRIYTKNKNLPPQYIARGAIVNNSLINEGCHIMGELNNSILFSEIIVEPGAIINNSVVLSNCTIKSGAVVNNAVILEDTVIEEDKRIGEIGDNKIYLVSGKKIWEE
ncbi:MAG: sugar phosphate nucleotidyltransferase, partial [Tissierellaceae bacterium]